MDNKSRQEVELMSRTSPKVPRMRTPTEPRDNLNIESADKNVTYIGKGEDRLGIEVIK